MFNLSFKRMGASKKDTDEELIGRLQNILVNCVGYDGDELASSRKQAYDYYFQRPRGDERVGGSTVVSGDLSSMVEGNLAKIAQPISGRKQIAEYCAYDEADEEQARLESDCVTHMLFRQQNGFIETVCAVKDCMLNRNAVVKIYVDKRTHKKRLRRQNVEPEIVNILLDDIGDVKLHSYDPKDKSLSATVIKNTKKFRLEAVSAENFLYPKNWNRQDLDGIPACFERHIESRATMVARGYDKDKVYALRAFNNAFQAGVSDRLPKKLTPFVVPADKSQELVEYFEGYVRLEESDGTDELNRVVFSDKTLLANDPAELVCYATGVLIINPHTHMGISMHDKIKGIQDKMTALERALLDNLNANNKNRTASLDGIVEQEDLEDGRINGNVRVREGRVKDVRAAIMAFPVNDTTAGILPAIENTRRERSEMGGASLDMSTGQMQLNDRLGSQGLDRAYSVMEELAQFMAQILANTLIRSMYLVAHETLRTQWDEPILFKRGKQWVKAIPNQWRVRDAVTINLGESPGTRARLAATLERLADKIGLLAQHGMEDIMVDAIGLYNALLDWLHVSDIEIPERYLLDPNSPKSQEQFKRRAIQRQQEQQKQDSMIQQAIALEQIRTALTKYTTDVETQFKYYAEVLNAQIEEAKMTMQALVDFAKVRKEAAIASGESLNEGRSNVDEGSVKATGTESSKQSTSE